MNDTQAIPEPAEWRLQFERGEVINNPTEAQISSGIASLRVVEGDNYCILSRPDGDYVQAMCGVNGIHVEWRTFYDGDWNRFRHTKAGRPALPRQDVRCQLPVHSVLGYDNELLGRRDARAIFLAFRRHEDRPTQYLWRPMDDAELS
jgi:hypothetical protein